MGTIFIDLFLYFELHNYTVQAMAIVYGQCYEEIGHFNDTAFMVCKPRGGRHGSICGGVYAPIRRTSL